MNFSNRINQVETNESSQRDLNETIGANEMCHAHHRFTISIWMNRANQANSIRSSVTLAGMFNCMLKPSSFRLALRGSVEQSLAIIDFPQASWRTIRISTNAALSFLLSCRSNFCFALLVYSPSAIQIRTIVVLRACARTSERADNGPKNE